MLSESKTRLRSALNGLKNGKDADAILVAIGSALLGASADAVKRCEEQITLFPISHPAGQLKYFTIQERFLRLRDELVLPIHVETHPGGTTSYAVLENDAVRMTVAQVLKRSHNPPPRPFRLNSHV